jgi:hypothetical protein
MSLAIFCTGVDYTRGSVLSYLVPFLVAILAFIFAHKIRESNNNKLFISSRIMLSIYDKFL